MIHYRTFRNTDPPALVDVWDQGCTGPGAAAIRSPLLLEHCVFAKPYFDPAGLTVALDQEQIVGWTLAGFAADAAGASLDCTTGVVCQVVVLPTYRRQGIGAELLKRSEEYLRQRGARVLLAGPTPRHNPFLFGLYGGSDTPGVLDSDALARPFLTRHGYAAAQTFLVFRRALPTAPTVGDARFGALRTRFEIHVVPRRDLPWFEERAVGPLELLDYQLVDKGTQACVARAVLWEMDPFGPRWNEHPVGILGLEVVPEHRRLGFAKFFLAQLLRHVYDQYFTTAEMQTPEDNQPAVGLLKGLGFQLADRGHRYRRDA